MPQQPPNREPTYLRFDRGSSPRSPVQWKLFIMVGMLIFVLIMMRFAGDPNNWRWMGFKQTDPPKPSRSPDVKSAALSADLQLSSIDRTMASANTDDSASTPPLKLNDLKPGLGHLQLDFWSRMVRRLDGPSRQTLYAMIQEQKSAVSDSLEARTNLVERISQFSDQFATDLLSQSGELSTSDPARKQLWYDLLFHWQKLWNEETKPLLVSLANSSDTPNLNIEAIAALRKTLSDVARGLVLDNAPIGRPLEVPFWSELVARARTDELTAPSAAPISHLELRAQPHLYRGNQVLVSGRIRGARLQKSANPLNGVAQYLELWIQADEASTIPICAFALEIPEGFPQVGEQLVTMDIPTRFVGYFFKSRSYLTTANTTQSCPVVLTKQPTVTIVAQNSTVVTPSFGTLATVLVVILLLSVWVAVRVYSSTVVLKRRPSPLIASTLGQLATDSQIQSVRERLGAWRGEEDAGESPADSDSDSA